MKTIEDYINFREILNRRSGLIFDGYGVLYSELKTHAVRFTIEVRPDSRIVALYGADRRGRSFNRQSFYGCDGAARSPAVLAWDCAELVLVFLEELANTNPIYAADHYFPLTRWLAANGLNL